MENIFTESLELIQNGMPFNINLKKRNLTVGYNKIIVDGKFEGELGVPERENIDEAILDIEDAFEKFYHSIPSEKTDARRKNYFVGLKFDELTHEDQIYGAPRDPARFVLEFVLLAHLIRGTFYWSENFKSWSWVSPRNRHLVILRQWIE